MKVRIAVCGLVLVAIQSLAAGLSPPSQSAINRRQLNDCMTRLMTASRSVSYNDATKACKEQLKQPTAVLSSNAVKPGTAR